MRRRRGDISDLFRVIYLFLFHVDGLADSTGGDKRDGCLFRRLEQLIRSVAVTVTVIVTGFDYMYVYIYVYNIYIVSLTCSQVYTHLFENFFLVEFELDRLQLNH